MNISIEDTPNPNALKFVCEKTLKNGKETIDSKEEGLMVPMIAALFDIEGIKQVHFFEKTVTITKENSIPWEEVENRVEETLLSYIDIHDPNFVIKPPEKELPPELKEIDDILSRTIRPGLQMDGGDLRVVSKEGKVITVSYEGACGTCPSSISGTLMAIQGILRDEYDPEVEVITDNNFI